MHQQRRAAPSPTSACGKALSYAGRSLDLYSKIGWRDFVEDLDDSCNIRADGDVRTTENALLCSQASALRALTLSYPDKDDLYALDNLARIAEDACALLPPYPPFVPPKPDRTSFWNAKDILITVALVVGVSLVFACVAGIIYVLSKRPAPVTGTTTITSAATTTTRPSAADVPSGKQAGTGRSMPPLQGLSSSADGGAGRAVQGSGAESVAPSEFASMASSAPEASSAAAAAAAEAVASSAVRSFVTKSEAFNPAVFALL